MAMFPTFFRLCGRNAAFASHVTVSHLAIDNERAVFSANFTPIDGQLQNIRGRAADSLEYFMAREVKKGRSGQILSIFSVGEFRVSFLE